MYTDPKLGKPETEASQGRGCETLGSRSGGGTVPTAVEGLGKRTKSREGRKGLGESFHGGLRVRALVRLNTSRACPTPCPGPRAMSQHVLGYQRPQLGSSHPRKEW